MTNTKKQDFKATTIALTLPQSFDKLMREREHLAGKLIGTTMLSRVLQTEMANRICGFTVDEVEEHYVVGAGDTRAKPRLFRNEHIAIARWMLESHILSVGVVPFEGLRLRVKWDIDGRTSYCYIMRSGPDMFNHTIYDWSRERTFPSMREEYWAGVKGNLSEDEIEDRDEVSDPASVETFIANLPPFKQKVVRRWLMIARDIAQEG